MNYSGIKTDVFRLNVMDGGVTNLTNENWVRNRSFQGLDYGPLLEGSGSKQSASDFPMWIQAAWIVVFGAMIIIATGGNCIVIWIVIAHRRMRTVTNYFLVNLSTADLLLTVFNCTFNSFYMIQRNWPFGAMYCTVSNFIANATVVASVFTLTGISCDRYLAIVYPLHPRMSKSSSLFTIFFIWTSSMIFASPCLLYSTTIIYRYRGVQRTGCIMVWPDKKLMGSKYDLGYQMLFLILAYLVPMTLMSLSYTMMGKELWGSKSIGELTQRQQDLIKSKRKVVKMFILVVVIFGICWLPYHSYFIYVYFDTSIIYSKYTQHVYLGFYWFAMSNAMFNPLIYYWMNARFRQYFKKAMCGWHIYFITVKRNSDTHQASPKNSADSKSGALNNLSVKAVKQSDNAFKDEKRHYALIAGTNGIPREQQRRMSNRATRTTSLKKDLRKTTFL
ncbi:tachykinin-like peptides receptor 86C [Anthonomus grandis grandis]|uniref:tachykinin-like peptides receptor 86C n=1 Tax=Anthonomus grandis grandis TaxID=2921223 RepID=UPI002165F37E|nr:tachykinin-like peptides receptor 86C [Anthonomus grandis grandis]XP_050308449.1 tachykinin-like peptides receptor 86C [Anthonomus grandis grandis]